MNILDYGILAWHELGFYLTRDLEGFPTDMLNLSDISISFQGKKALDGISLSFEAKRTTVLIGPSGCGKSTILRIIVGLLLPDRGYVEFEGLRLSREIMLASRRRMGYVIQEGGLFPHLTGRDNVAIAAESLGKDRKAIEERIEELRRLVRLPADALERYPAQLSGGQRQRISLMRALMLDPALLLLDEPLAALDPMIRAELQEDLRAIFRSLGKTVLMVTHDMGEAVFFGDRIVLLREGRIVQCGGPEDLLQRPADVFVSKFIQAQRSPSERRPVQ
jgi:osmoprotectant transport system ATP-binding protein